MATKPTTKKSAKRPPRGAIPLPETDIFGARLSDMTNVVNLPLGSIEPDPNQARWLLPPEIRAKFVKGEINAAQALERWRKHVERIRSASPDHPEVRKLKLVEDVARSIRTSGQVNPITVVRQDRNMWRIETGERRFWAHVWLVYVDGDKSAETVPVNPQLKIDPFRQAVENLHASPLNAIGLAREVARLLMASSKTDTFSQDGAPLTIVDYRQVATERVPPGGWKRIEEAMGATADHLTRSLRLLLLPDEAIDTADRNDLTERQLRPALDLKDPKLQMGVVKVTAELKLSTAQVEWLCRQPDFKKAERELRAQADNRTPARAGEKTPRARFAPEQILYNRLLSFGRFVESLRKGGGDPAEALARHYVADRGDAAETAIGEMIELLSRARGQIRLSRGGASGGDPAQGQD